PDELAGGAGRLWLTGYELTTLGPAWAAAGLPIAPDARPDEHFYERSDNIAFVHRQVIGQTLSSFNLHGEYHTVADEPDTLDYAHMEAAARAAYAACRMLADGTLEPSWAAPVAPAAPAASPGG
ncbi:MAG TPA: M28 family peptidase, partial [Planctomycetota bacterium]|nr:M28 family peptidase [Planctomycetota bacterium]